MRKSELKVTDDHINLLRNMEVSWDDAEFGAPCIDPKRPYGNSYVVGDIAEILGWEPEGNKEEEEGLSDEQVAEATRIHREMEQVFRLMLKTWVPLK